MSMCMDVLQEGGPLPGPKTGLLSNTWKWIVWGGNGNPLQCSCLENPGDGGSWWAAVYGIAQGRTRLKRLSSSSSMLRYASSMPTFWRVFIVNACWILSKVFSASIEMIIWFLFFSLLMWCITLIDLCILNNPCIPEMNPTLSWCMTF